jgi:hypothetical protein
MLAEVDSAFALRLENVTCERDRDCARRSAVAATLDLGAEVEQLRLLSL